MTAFRSPAISHRLYRLALRCYPPDFRTAYGTGMRQTFAGAGLI